MHAPVHHKGYLLLEVTSLRNHNSATAEKLEERAQQALRPPVTMSLVLLPESSTSKYMSISKLFLSIFWNHSPGAITSLLQQEWCKL